MSEMLSEVQSVQIMVKWFDGKTTMLDVNPGVDTIASAKAKLTQRVKEKIDPARFALVRAGKPLPDADRLDVHGIKAGSELSVAIRKQESDLMDEAVLEHLRKELKSLETYTGGKLFVFIGVGSYDHQHGDESVKRQQCPDSLLRWCDEHGWALKVILIDKGFSAPDTYPQAYHLASQGWSDKPTSPLEGKVRRYGNKIANREILTFATGVPEYGDLHNGKLAGYAFNALMSKWTNRNDLCLVCGNFYASPTEKQDYITIGPLSVITGAGFIYNG